MSPMTEYFFVWCSNVMKTIYRKGISGRDLNKDQSDRDRNFRIWIRRNEITDPTDKNRIKKIWLWLDNRTNLHHEFYTVRNLPRIPHREKRHMKDDRIMCQDDRNYNDDTSTSWGNFRAFRFKRLLYKVQEIRVLVVTQMSTSIIRVDRSS